MTREEQEQYIQHGRDKIVFLALNIARLRTMRCYVTDDGTIAMLSTDNDVATQIQGHEILLRSRAEGLLALMTVEVHDPPSPQGSGGE